MTSYDSSVLFDCINEKSHASPKWILTGRGDQYITANSESISEKIDIIMQLANKNKMVRKRMLYLYGKKKLLFILTISILLIQINQIFYFLNIVVVQI